MSNGWPSAGLSFARSYSDFDTRLSIDVWTVGIPSALLMNASASTSRNSSPMRFDWIHPSNASRIGPRAVGVCPYLYRRRFLCANGGFLGGSSRLKGPYG